MLTANRGLCGGYNNNVIREAFKLIDARRAAGQDCELHVSGKKGLAYCRFFGYAIASSTTRFEDKPAYEQVEPIAASLLQRFEAGEIDELHLVYTKFLSSAAQRVTSEQLLPLTLPASSTTPSAVTAAEYIFEPSAEQLLASLIPEAFKTAFFTAFLHAAASEQVARMVAMKNATDAAEEMIKDLTRLYNRARQTQITMEIAELLGGAEALKES
jgi:F-type H+-transporting ATPase subunit gamma